MEERSDTEEGGHRPRRPVTTLAEIARLLPRAGLGLVAGAAAVNLVLGVLPVAFVVATSFLIGRVPAALTEGPDSAEWDALVAAFTLAAAAFVAQQMIAPLATSLGELAGRRIDGKVYRSLMATSLHSPGVAPLENQQVLDELRASAAELEYGVQSPGQAAAGLLAMIARYAQLAGFVVVVGLSFSWLVAALLLAAVLLFRYVQRAGLAKYARARVQLMPLERTISYFRQLAVASTTAKEIRVFGLADWLKGRVTAVTHDFLRPLWAVRRRVYLWPYVRAAVVLVLLYLLVFVALGVRAPDTLALTTFALVLQAILGAIRMSEYYPEADLQTTVGMEGHRAVQRFADRVEAVGHTSAVVTARDEPGAPTEVPDPVDSIRFAGVSFRYPGHDRVIFDHLELTIPAGRCTAVVGVNGAGKTTLIKLLARLYDPTDGAVLADGVDIRSYPIEGWRAKLSVIFQDFLRFEVSAADNIGFGSIEHLDDRAGIRAAAEAAGIAAMLDRLPRGMDTPLARHIAGGAELSGGQWQRVALARALFALHHGAPMVVLDEPTASLDMRAEASFFDEFANLTRGATTMLISHRFSTVRHADLIVVLEDGRVLEQGSHESLMAEQGRYADLFRLQADRLTGSEAGRAIATDGTK